MEIEVNSISPTGEALILKFENESYTVKDSKDFSFDQKRIICEFAKKRFLEQQEKAWISEKYYNEFKAAGYTPLAGRLKTLQNQIHPHGITIEVKQNQDEKAKYAYLETLKKNTSPTPDPTQESCDNWPIYSNNDTQVEYAKFNNGTGTPNKDLKSKHTHGLRVLKNKNTKIPDGYAGRAETVPKAEEVAKWIFQNELKAGNLKKDTNGTYHISFAVQSLCKRHLIDDLFGHEYKKFTEAEKAAYEELVQNKPRNPLKMDGKEFVVDNVFISSTPINPFCYAIDLFLPEWISHHNQVSEKISKEDDDKFFAFAEKKDPTLLTNQNYKAAKAALQKSYKEITKPWDDLLLREYLYILAGIPAVKHCKSSKDRTSVALAIGVTLRQWIRDDDYFTFEDLSKLTADDKFKQKIWDNLLLGIPNALLNIGKYGLKLKPLSFETQILKVLLPESKLSRNWVHEVRAVFLFLLCLPALLASNILVTVWENTKQMLPGVQADHDSLFIPESVYRMWEDLWFLLALKSLAPEASDQLFYKKGTVIDVPDFRPSKS